MIFGNPLSFAVEAIVEPGPEFSPVFGANVAGRMRVLVGGTAVGDIEKPSCVPRALSEHLVQLCATAGALWHPLLAGIAPEEQFKMLDEALFLGGGNPELEQCHDLVFLTNVSEAFDPVKGFVLAPSSGEMVLLVKLNIDSPLIHRAITQTEFCEATAAFANWVNEQEHELLNESAV